MAKFDLNSIVKDVLKTQHNKNMNAVVGTGDNLKTIEANNFLSMPNWWVSATHTPGLPYGKIVMIAGDSDSGKTSAAVAAMKSAQAQNVAILYVETEGKTSKEDLVNWGVDPSQVMLVQSSIAEHAFEAMFNLWDGYFKKYPKEKLLVIYDSLGNVVSRRDAEMDLSTSSQKPGGKGQINRLGLNKLIAKRDDHEVAILIINYTYDNIGSPGKTNAGGKSVNFFSSLTYQTTRKQWLEKTVKGEKVRIGARVQWKLFKNHINKSNPGPKVVEFDITKDGFELVGASNDDSE